MPDQTNITPPRVPFTDLRTGLISREWYRFFLSLFNLTGGGTNTVTLVDLQLGPADQQQDEQRLYALTNQLETLPPVVPVVLPDDPSRLSDGLSDQVSEIQKQLDALWSTVNGYPVDQLCEVQKQIDALNVTPRVEPEPRLKSYAQFVDLTDQSIAATYTPQAVTFDTTNLTDGFSIVSSSQITASVKGKFNFQFSLQLESGSAATKLIWAWFRKNGTDIANSNSYITISGSAWTIVPSWNYVIELNVGDYIQLMWASDDTNVSISHHAAEVGATGTAAFARPAVPSAILTVTPVVI